MAQREFPENLDEIENGTYYFELITREEAGIGRSLRSFCEENIYKTREIQSLELTGERVITGLLNHFVKGLMDIGTKSGRQKADKLLSLVSNGLKIITQLEMHEEDYKKWNAYARIRLAVDYISGMTDSFALNLYRRLEGMRIR
jgi:dGTPase